MTDPIERYHDAERRLSGAVQAILEDALGVSPGSFGTGESLRAALENLDAGKFPIDLCTSLVEARDALDDVERWRAAGQADVKRRAGGT